MLGKAEACEGFWLPAGPWGDGPESRKSRSCLNTTQQCSRSVLATLGSVLLCHGLHTYPVFCASTRVNQCSPGFPTDPRRRSWAPSIAAWSWACAATSASWDGHGVHPLQGVDSVHAPLSCCKYRLYYLSLVCVFVLATLTHTLVPSQGGTYLSFSLDHTASPPSKW